MLPFLPMPMQTPHFCRDMECNNRRKVTMHRKDIADGDGSAVSGMVKGSFQDEYGKGTQNLVHHLAYKYPQLNTERRTRYYGVKGLYTTTRYIFMYIPEDRGSTPTFVIFQMPHTPNLIFHNPSLRCKWLHKKNKNKTDHDMSVFRPEVEILGLLAVFVSDFLSSSYLPSIMFFAPILVVHNH